MLTTKLLLADPLCIAYGEANVSSMSVKTKEFLDQLDASADAISSENGLVELDGSTIINFSGRRILAENASYNSLSGLVSIDGEFSYSTPDFMLESQNANIYINNNTFKSGKSNYQLSLDGRIAQGRAKSLQRRADGRIKLNNATYSACPPNEEAWEIRSTKIRLDPTEGIGRATHITLRFHDVPILYAPLFSFPINNKRKSGFLAPNFRQADNTGVEILIPWYWNIAPNLDATITPRYMSRWGTQIQGEFRYLNAIGNWQLDTEYLEHNIENDSNTNDHSNRRFTRFHHKGKLRKGWTSLIDASSVTDKDYFKDFGDSLNIASITHLNRRAELRYQGNVNSMLFRIQRYQTVDKDIVAEKRPYLRLPQITWNANYPKTHLGLKTDIRTEAVHFDREDSVTGTRIDLHPKLSLPFSSDSWFFKPTAAWRYTYYQLNNLIDAGDTNINNSKISRNLPYFSIDGGLFFDRSRSRDGSVQTLEPRIYYLNVPYKDQSDIPIFDSSQLDFNFSQLFRENRFAGKDRVADANQLSTAITTRFIDGPSGRELLRASLGQIVYFDDRRVFLNQGDDDDTSGSSDIVGELFAELKHDWVVKSNTQWNPYTSSTVRSSFLLGYRPSEDKVINIAHRTITGNTEQVDISGFWPLKNNWKAIGRWNYALDTDKSIETTLGLEYESCCWALRFAARRYIADDGLDHDTNYFIELILKGLAPVGDNVGQILKSGVLGYSDSY